METMDFPEREKIEIADFNCNVGRIWVDDWLLLNSGDFNGNVINTMAVGWGFFGTMWALPMAVAVVRPHRHSFQLMEKYDTFTLTAFPAGFKKEIAFCGKNSGKDVDKFAATGLIPIASEKVAAPSIAQAELVIECEKVYVDEFKARKFLDKSIARGAYEKDDFHVLYYGKIVNISGIGKYKKEI